MVRSKVYFIDYELKCSYSCMFADHDFSRLVREVMNQKTSSEIAIGYSSDDKREIFRISKNNKVVWTEN